MSDFASNIEHEFSQAFQVKDKHALKRAALLLSDRFVDRAKYTYDVNEIKSEVRVLTETMRVEFEHVDKRFETLIGQTDRRFDDVQRTLGRQTTAMFWGGSILFTLLTVLMSIYEFIS